MADPATSAATWTFPSTDWSAVGTAAAGADPEASAALDRLLTRYLPALRAFLVVERRMDVHRADDLLQGFVAERILEKNLLAQADRGRGRFRSFLLACLIRYVSAECRREAAAIRHPGPGKLKGLDAPGVQLLTPETRSDAFDLAWAQQVVADALKRMKDECDSGLRPDLWAIFEGRVLLPATQGAAPLEYGQLVERFGFASVAQATNALVTAKRMYARSLRRAVAQYAGADGAEVDEELRRLRTILACPRHA